MRTTLFYILFFFLTIILFNSCRLEEYSIDETTINSTETATLIVDPFLEGVIQGRNSGTLTADGLQFDCLTINFPITFIVDSARVTVNNYNELDSLFDELMNSSSAASFYFVFPLNITYQNDSSEVIQDIDELYNAILTCLPNNYSSGFPAFLPSDFNCFDLIYPITLMDEDSTLYSAVDEAEFVDLLAVNGPLQFTFPLDVLFQGGSIITLDSEDELYYLLGNCDNDHNFDITPFSGCYFFEYPVGLVTPMGEVVTFDSAPELYNALLVGNYVDFHYPIYAIVDGNRVTVNNYSELENALSSCGGSDKIEAIYFLGYAIDPNEMCYDLVYPITVFSEDGGASILIDQAGLENYFENEIEPTDYVTTPIDIINSATGEIVTLNSDLDHSYFIYEYCN